MATIALIFILGLCFGSFLNVLIYREINEEPFKKNKLKLPSWLLGRSFCDHCRRQISWYDNIPLFSYLILGGKCRYCRKKIDFQYPIIELLTGVEFIWIYFLISQNLDFLSKFEGFYSFMLLTIWFVIGACFLGIFITDIRYQIIPDFAVYAGIISSLLKALVDYRYTGMVDFSIFVSGMGAMAFFLLLVFLTHGRGMGLGDVKLALFLGLILGWPKILIAVFLAFLTGSIVGVILIITGKKKLKSKIAFGPFLVLGAIFSLFYGQQIWLYFN